MNRRNFIKIAASATAALVLPACQTAPDPTVTPLKVTPSKPPAPTATIAPAAKPARTPVTLPGADAWKLVSKTNGQEYRIFIIVPRGQDATPLPVIYLTDGNGSFPLLYTILGQLVGDNYMKPAIIVGIGYPFDEYDEYKDLRARDFTPTMLPYNPPDQNSFPAGTGGAPAFLRFLHEELKPMIDSKYNTLTDDATLVGHSFGGLFALYALFQGTAPFQRYVIGSPSIWWDNKAIMNNMTSFSSTHTDLSARVFMSVGESEDPYMVTYMQELANKLEGYQYPGLTLTTHVFEAETHLSVIPFFISRGLRAVYA